MPNKIRMGGLLLAFSAKGHVRFTPKSGHVRCNYRCPLWAKSDINHSFDHVGGGRAVPVRGVSEVIR
jgi:hypothetical protein